MFSYKIKCNVIEISLAVLLHLKFKPKKRDADKSDAGKDFLTVRMVDDVSQLIL